MVAHFTVACPRSITSEYFQSKCLAHYSSLFYTIPQSKICNSSALYPIPIHKNRVSVNYLLCNGRSVTRMRLINCIWGFNTIRKHLMRRDLSRIATSHVEIQNKSICHQTFPPAISSWLKLQGAQTWAFLPEFFDKPTCIGLISRQPTFASKNKPYNTRWAYSNTVQPVNDVHNCVQSN